jgi:hypothetical protein
LIIRLGAKACSLSKPETQNRPGIDKGFKCRSVGLSWMSLGLEEKYLLLQRRMQEETWHFPYGNGRSFNWGPKTTVLRLFFSPLPNEMTHIKNTDFLKLCDNKLAHWERPQTLVKQTKMNKRVDGFKGCNCHIIYNKIDWVLTVCRVYFSMIDIYQLDP